MEDKKLNNEQRMLLAALCRKEIEKLDQKKEIGKRLYRKYSKIIFALTGKNY